MNEKLGREEEIQRTQQRFVSLMQGLLEAVAALSLPVGPISWKSDDLWTLKRHIDVICKPTASSAPSSDFLTFRCALGVRPISHPAEALCSDACSGRVPHLPPDLLRLSIPHGPLLQS